MRATGWLGPDEPDATPAMPTTELLLRMRGERAPGGTLEHALARARAAEAREIREAAAAAPDPDERAANLVTRGYTPGLLYELTQRLGDTMADLEAEREKIEKGERRQEQVRRMHERGQCRAWDIPQLLGDDLGDADQVTRLEKRAQGLRRQIDEAQAMIAPQPQRDLDPVEGAVKRARDAHAEFVEVTRAMMAGQSRPGPRPKGPGGAGGDDAPVYSRSAATCGHCAEIGATPAERQRIHAGLERGTASPDLAAYDAEVTRLTDAGYSLATAQDAAAPLMSR